MSPVRATPEQIADTITDLERLGVPVTATRAEAQQALRLANRGVSTDRLRAALNSRRASDGVVSRNRGVAALRTPAGRRKRKAPPPLAAILFDVRLIDAACVGHHRLFDGEREGERATDRAARHAEAARICRHCPVTPSCEQVASEIGREAIGVWAGRVRNPPSKQARTETTVAGEYRTAEDLVKKSRRCTHSDCRVRHSSSSGLCARHRQQLVVVWDRGRVHIGSRSFTLDEAVRLADAIVDAVESRPE